MSKLSSAFQRILAFFSGLLMALVFAIIFLNSLRRYATGRSWEWGEELPIYLTVYGVMFGLAMAYLQDRHIRFTVLTDLVPVALRKRIFAAMDVVTVGVGAALSWSGYVFAMRRPQIEASGLIGVAGDIAEATGLGWLEWLGRMGTWQFAIFFGGAILSLAALIRFFTRVREV